MLFLKAHFTGRYWKDQNQLFLYFYYDLRANFLALNLNGLCLISECIQLHLLFIGRINKPLTLRDEFYSLCSQKAHLHWHIPLLDRAI
jgi:hypothetical protein